MAFGDSRMFDDMQIEKWLKSNDNTLIVTIIDGKVKQNMLIKFQNVECGELNLKLKWLSPHH